VDGLGLKETYGYIPEHVLFSAQNLNKIVQMVDTCLITTEIGLPILSPHENSLRAGDPDIMAALPMDTAWNYGELLPRDFAAVGSDSL
jgi:hypothetical protein